MSYTVDVNFINPFIQGAIETLKVQCHIEARPGKPHLKNAEELNGAAVDIAGIIGITSEGFTGSIALCFPAKTFLNVMEKMLDEKFAEITKEVEDGAGELTNIIFGAAKRELNKTGYTLQKALPSVVRGPSLNVRYLTPSPTIVLPFETEVGLFHIEIATEPLSK